MHFKSHYIQLTLAAEESRGNLLALNESAQVLESIEAQSIIWPAECNLVSGTKLEHSFVNASSCVPRSRAVGGLG